MREPAAITLLQFCCQSLNSLRISATPKDILNWASLRQFMPVLRKTGNYKPAFTRTGLERNGHVGSSQPLSTGIPFITHIPAPSLPGMDNLHFEYVLLAYLSVAMAIQHVNIYKANFYVMDYHLIMFISIILLRRLGWLILKQTLASEVIHSVAYWSKVAMKSSFLIVLSVVCIYSLYNVLQNSALEDVLCLCYPLGVYLWTFGCTMNPYGHKFLFKLGSHQSAQVQELISSNTSIFTQPVTLQKLTFNPMASAVPTMNRTATTQSTLRHRTKSGAELNGIAGNHISTKPISNGHVGNEFSRRGDCPIDPCLMRNPENVRYEAECFRTDFNLRMKQILFNSLVSAYYVGFIPLKFTQNGWLYYDLWWSAQHVLFVSLNTFVLLINMLVPHHYVDGLHKCASHLGGWKQCTRARETPHVWSPMTMWPQGVLVRHSKGIFRALGKQNASIPGDSHHSRFYLIFKTPLRMINCLVVLQLITVFYQLYVLTRSTFWYQCISVVCMLVINYWLLFGLLRDRWAVMATLEEHEECSGSAG